MFLKLSIVFVLFISHCHTKPVSNKSAHITDEIVSIFIIKDLKLKDRSNKGIINFFYKGVHFSPSFKFPAII